MSNALQGIQKGLAGVDKNAAQIAGADNFKSDNPASSAQALVELQNNRMQVEVSAKAMKSVNEAIGSLLDVVA